MKFERFERLSHQQVYNRCVIKQNLSIFPFKPLLQAAKKKIKFSKLP